jgi:O-antigen/teichoic acid export membrane protein
VGLSAWRRVASFGGQMMAVSGITSLSSRLSDLAVGRILGLSELGIMSRATALNGLLWNNIHMVVGRVLLVDFSALHREGTPLRERYIRTVEITTAVLWPAFAGIAVLAAPLISLVYGERWVPAAHPLQLLAVASMIQVSISMTWELFASTGNLRTQTRIEFIRTTISLSLFVGACFISLEAAVATRIIDAFLALALYRRHVDAMTSTRTRDFLRPYAVSAALTVLAIGPALVVALSTGFSADVGAGLLAGSVLGGVLLWFIGLRVLRHPLADDLWPRSWWSRSAPSSDGSTEQATSGSAER